MTWIEVADTAIKVGLGALLSGVTTYIVLRARQRGEVQIEQHRRRRELIEEVCDLLDDVVNEVQLFTADVFRDVGDDHIRPLTEDQIVEVRRRFAKAGRDIRRIHTRLVLLQEDEAIKHMSATAALLSVLIREIQKPNSGLSGRVVNDTATEIAKVSAGVHRALAPAYKSTL